MYSEDKFNYAVIIILDHEGREGIVTLDDGGTTKYGITESFLKANNIPVVNDDYSCFIFNLTRNEAVDLYKRYIWDKYHYGLLESIEISTKVFDMTVNMGPYESHVILQRSINAMSHDLILVDGKMGVKTIFAANNLPASYLHEELREQCSIFYKQLIKEKPNLKLYINGWLKRAEW